jgi:sulfate adenylyltransferase large subunit
MVTGASTADVALVLVDARKGVIEQTRRHASIVRLLGVPHVVFCVNKLDLADYSEARFREIEDELATLASRIGIRDAASIPLAALHGDNVVEPSPRMPWWSGGTLLEQLESVETAADRDALHRRFPVQWVIRPMSDAFHDYRGYAGQVAGGEWRAGDDVVVLPSGLRTRVAAVETHDGPVDVAVQGMSVVIRLDDDLDVPRGEMLVAPDDQPICARSVTATVCWMSERPSVPGARFAVKHTTRWSRAILDRIESKLDVDTLAQIPADTLELNDLATIRLRLASPLLVDPYDANRATGSFIVVDEASNDTVAAGMVVSAEP